MRMPLHITTDMIKYQTKMFLQRRTRYPFVMMLEPLYTCNLACIGCSIERHTGKLKDRVPVERCLEALDHCGAPSVSICGGEPTVYPELPELIEGVIDRKRHIYLCTNALLLDKKVFGVIPPNKRLTINVHLDGLKETHDMVCAKEGVFDKAVEMIEESKRRGFHTWVNTTIYKETSASEVRQLCEMLKKMNIDGILISPGYHYESVEQDIFLTRNDIQQKFEEVLSWADEFPLTSTPQFLEFAAGRRDYNCSPWSTVTFTPMGWKKPCYLIGKGFVDSWDEFWNNTDWDYWESREDELCQNCAMHSGFEASAVIDSQSSPKEMFRLAAWNMTG